MYTSCSSLCGNGGKTVAPGQVRGAGPGSRVLGSRSKAAPTTSTEITTDNGTDLAPPGPTQALGTFLTIPSLVQSFRYFFIGLVGLDL